MKKILYYIVFIWIFMIVIPVLCVFGRELIKSDGFQNNNLGYFNKSYDENIILSVLVVKENKIKQMELGEYLKGVISAEMPAAYNIEALKAQAVAARSYTYNKFLKSKDIPEHNGADICTDSGHCQAFLTLDEANEKWGDEWGEKYYEKIEQAVFQTDGQVLEYQNEPIVAAFHSSSYGRTENAKDIWGNEVEYLKSVENKGDKSLLEGEVYYSKEEFKSLMLENYPDIDLQGEIESWVKKFKYSEGGSVLSVDIGNKIVNGSLVRAIFSLKSSNFDITTQDQSFVFTVKGAGHGVGMSQYGANAMAGEGSDYKEILKWYYQGVSIDIWGN